VTLPGGAADAIRERRLPSGYWILGRFEEIQNEPLRSSIDKTAARGKLQEITAYPQWYSVSNYIVGTAIKNSCNFGKFAAGERAKLIFIKVFYEIIDLDVTTQSLRSYYF